MTLSKLFTLLALSSILPVSGLEWNASADAVLDAHNAKHKAYGQYYRALRKIKRPTSAQKSALKRKYLAPARANFSKVAVASEEQALSKGLDKAIAVTKEFNKSPYAKEQKAVNDKLKAGKISKAQAKAEMKKIRKKYGPPSKQIKKAMGNLGFRSGSGGSGYGSTGGRSGTGKRGRAAKKSQVLDGSGLKDVLEFSTKKKKKKKSGTK